MALSAAGAKARGGPGEAKGAKSQRPAVVDLHHLLGEAAGRDTRGCEAWGGEEGGSERIGVLLDGVPIANIEDAESKGRLRVGKSGGGAEGRRAREKAVDDPQSYGANTIGPSARAQQDRRRNAGHDGLGFTCRNGEDPGSTSDSGRAEGPQDLPPWFR
jgi:hypothetical protein